MYPVCSTGVYCPLTDGCELKCFTGFGTLALNSTINHTCDIADETGLDDQRWVRKCPEGVKSCFWAKGNYEKQSKAKN